MGGSDLLLSFLYATVGKEHTPTLQRKRALNRWRKVREQRRKHLQAAQGHPDYDVMKARLLGYLAGDGCVMKWFEKPRNVWRYCISFYPDDEYMLEAYQESLRYTYGLEAAWKWLPGHIEARVQDRVACEDLIRYPLGTYDWRLPRAHLQTRTAFMCLVARLLRCGGLRHASTHSR